MSHKESDFEQGVLLGLIFLKKGLTKNSQYLYLSKYLIA
jgi:hypothetical protein